MNSPSFDPPFSVPTSAPGALLTSATGEIYPTRASLRRASSPPPLFEIEREIEAELEAEEHPEAHLHSHRDDLPAAMVDAQPWVISAPAFARSTFTGVPPVASDPAQPPTRPYQLPLAEPKPLVSDIPLVTPIDDPQYDPSDVARARIASPYARGSGLAAGSSPALVAALEQVLVLGASDLHLSGNAAPMVRIDGHLRVLGGSTPWSAEQVTAALLSILSVDQEHEFAENLELDLAITLSPTARFRVNLYQQRGIVGAAFRLIPTEIKQLAELGVPDTIGKFAALPRGLVLVTGPTGSGKSTTLAALIDLVNRTRTDHIVTVEDPIEFLHTNKKCLVTQREVGPDTHSFASALKHVLRQDPDVILIGELRDHETISVALTAAETGHLVFATLHTRDAAQSIDRIIDVFPPHQQSQVRSQLAATLQGVVSQTLVPRAVGEGRVVATEVLVSTPAVANLIREGKTHQITSAMQAGRDHGMHTLDQKLAELVDIGTISHAAAVEKARDVAALTALIQRTSPAGTAPIAAGGVDYGDAFSESDNPR
ncbi:MAG: type pilus twitching motility protein PilT [Glaciihabitans sp.]|nr:type pilus twitching motility protein PilT [Glaciihabitans sp.]